MSRLTCSKAKEIRDILTEGDSGDTVGGVQVLVTGSKILFVVSRRWSYAKSTMLSTCKILGPGLCTRLESSTAVDMMHPYLQEVWTSRQSQRATNA